MLEATFKTSQTFNLKTIAIKREAAAMPARRSSSAGGGGVENFSGLFSFLNSTRAMLEATCKTSQTFNLKTIAIKREAAAMPARLNDNAGGGGVENFIGLFF